MKDIYYLVDSDADEIHALCMIEDNIKLEKQCIFGSRIKESAWGFHWNNENGKVSASQLEVPGYNYRKLSFQDDFAATLCYDALLGSAFYSAGYDPKFQKFVIKDGIISLHVPEPLNSNNTRQEDDVLL